MKHVHKILFGLILLTQLPALSAPAPDAATSGAQLDSLRSTILSVQQDLQTKQEAHRRVQQTLNQTKAELAQAQRELNSLTKQQKAAWDKYKGLQDHLMQLQTTIANTRAQVTRLVVNNYKNPQPAAVALFLKNADANQKSRFLTYTRYLNQANNKIIQNLAQQERDLASQEKAVNAELTRIQQLAAAQQQKMRRLGQTHSKAQSESQQLNREIGKRQRKLDQLRADEQRLNQIIAGISAKQEAQRKAEAPSRTQTAQQRAQAANRTIPDKSRLTRSDLALAPEQNARPQRAVMPSAGHIAGSFGAARETGGTWRGLFFATAPSAVHSVAAGQVQYAAGTSGYGNTVIIDHGNGYMSVYSGLSAISVGSGSHVNAGQTIGTSGTLPAGEQGLYFELRYRNGVINPKTWLH